MDSACLGHTNMPSELILKPVSPHGHQLSPKSHIIKALSWQRLFHLFPNLFALGFIALHRITSKSADSKNHSPDRASQQRRIPEEKGPFGRATGRRGLSRSKTFTPSGVKKEDKDAQENWKSIDEIFQKAKDNSANAEKQLSAPDSQSQPNPSLAGAPTEVILYGFAEVYQWAAIEFYERVSLGTIYEDYDRTPPNPKYNQSLSHSASIRATKIPSEALRKVNKFHGGAHWIKVTFDSAEAADRACHASPHKLNGYLVYAERYRGTGPNADVAIPATDEAVRGISASPSQNSTSSTILSQGNGHSSTTTASSATATQSSSLALTQSSTITTSHSTNALTSPSTSTSTAIASPGKKPLLRGAKRIELLPAEKAVLPATSRWQRTFGAWPLIGFFFGGSHNDMIGDQVPLKDNGDFDWETASLYWRFWALLDFYIFFANFLGLKGDD
jgi:hypothetical protein